MHVKPAKLTSSYSISDCRLSTSHHTHKVEVCTIQSRSEQPSGVDFHAIF